MKIAVSTTGKTLKGNVSTVFGRSPYFILIILDNGEIKEHKLLENKSAKQTGGAGISAAQQIAEEKANAIITGNLGPRAADVLKQFRIKAYRGTGQIRKTIDLFLKGKLEEY